MNKKKPEGYNSHGNNLQLTIFLIYLLNSNSIDLVEDINLS